MNKKRNKPYRAYLSHKVTSDYPMHKCMPNLSLQFECVSDESTCEDVMANSHRGSFSARTQTEHHGDHTVLDP
ncbi:hypothetical protein ECG_07410 [Echinococcus granulosus]|uniref:Ovule protein n=1 Tax=Echinococcus granulosus TaxID=6210 RepID=A0A068WWT8_ECHGR|nr:hypothetical protein ECG_07410 [Echinococcus granulosus]CDS22106.1 hypothetical protein EgrG_002025700 [Echinococcus granulosus]